MSDSVLTALIGIAGAIIAALVTAGISMKFGLPGISRDIEGQQTLLIATLRGRIEAYEESEKEAQECLEENARLRDENEDLRARALKAEGELLDILRGNTPRRSRKGES